MSPRCRPPIAYTGIVVPRAISANRSHPSGAAPALLLHRPEHREVELAAPSRAPALRGYGRTPRPARRRGFSVERHQLRSGEVHAVGAGMRPLHHDLAAVAPCARDGLVDEVPALLRARAAGRASVPARGACSSFSSMAAVPQRPASVMAYSMRQRERGEHRRVRRQHRRRHLCAGPLPGDRLVFPRMRLAAPGDHPEEVAGAPLRADR